MVDKAEHSYYINDENKELDGYIPLTVQAKRKQLSIHAQ